MPDNNTAMSDEPNKDDGFYSDMSKLNFGDKPWNIIENGTDTSLQDELEQILANFGGFVLNDQKTITKHIDKASKAILATVSKHLPEKHNNHGHPMSTIAGAKYHAWNTAITEMEKLLTPADKE